MASYFGEVIHPKSRAFWLEDEDDDINDSDIAELEIKWSIPEPSEFEKFIIVEGEMITGFITRSILVKGKCICTIGFENEKKCSRIYLAAGLYFCLVDKDLDLAHAGVFTATIAPILSKSKSIIALTSEHMAHYKGDERINSPSFFKSLYSTNARVNMDPRFSILKQPNFVTGVCAGVLSYSDIANLHCVMYILYTDTFVLDSKNALPLLALLSDLLGKQLPYFTAETTRFFNKGNLYM